MCDLMAHRGPDAEGYHLNGEVALGHRRLSIIDLHTGDQPMYNESRTVAVVFNGEIYNFQTLRRELEAKGHRFTTRSDTEVIPHLYEEHGPEAVTHLRGMFALALWDSRKRRLLLARDRMGQKPLFYSRVGRGMVFASEMKSILASRRVEDRLDYMALDSYLSHQFIPAPLTIYQEVRKLPPAHMAVWEDGMLELRRYWTPPGETAEMEEEECAARLLELLGEAVEMRLISDVPLGAFLSGGIDSSLVIALMTRISGNPVESFSIGFGDSSYDELPAARRAAALFGAIAHEKVVDYRVKELLPALVRHFDEPFGDSSALPVYYLSQMTREHVKVALSGDGCDEALGGYRRYAAARLARYARLLPPSLRGKLLDKFLRMLPEGTEYYGDSLTKKLRLFSEHLQTLSETGFASWYITFNRREKELLYGDELKVRLCREGGEDPVDGWVRGHRGPERLAEMMRADIQFYLPDDILAKVDRMSMAHSLEVRSPFLDHKLQEFVATIPLHLKVRGMELKYILKRAAAGLLPKDITGRPKHGFQVPVGRWFREGLSDYLRDELLSSLKGLFRPEYIEGLLHEHQVTGRRDHGQKLWTLLILALWFKEHPVCGV
jgi:asparagine synthase (glutamine-hydrolysing)